MYVVVAESRPTAEIFARQHRWTPDQWRYAPTSRTVEETRGAGHAIWCVKDWTYRSDVVSLIQALEMAKRRGIEILEGSVV